MRFIVHKKIVFLKINLDNNLYYPIITMILTVYIVGVCFWVNRKQINFLLPGL